MALAKILVAETDRDLSAAIGGVLKAKGYSVSVMNDGVLALYESERDDYDLLIVGDDVTRLPSSSVARSFFERRRAPVIILLKKPFGSYGCERTDNTCSSYLDLPFTAEALEKEVAKAIRSRDA